MNVWQKIFNKIAPNANPRIASMVIDHATDVFRMNGISNMRRQASIMAHMCVETGGFRTLEENLNYSAPRLMQVWPNRFPNEAIATECAHNPEKLACRVYNGRMGNRPGTDDGWVYRGKGLLQLTGRGNYQLLGKRMGVPASTIADWIIDPEHALECACQIYNMLNVGPAADAGDMKLQTRRINGGYNGLAERQKYYTMAMRILAAEAAPTVIGVHDDEPSPDHELDNITADNLRKNGSRTISSADRVKGASAGVATTAVIAGGTMTQMQGVTDTAQQVVDNVEQGKGILQQVESHWQIFVIAFCVAMMCYFAWRAWREANRVIEARVDDASTGANLGR